VPSQRRARPHPRARPPACARPKASARSGAHSEGGEISVTGAPQGRTLGSWESRHQASKPPGWRRWLTRTSRWEAASWTSARGARRVRVVGVGGVGGWGDAMRRREGKAAGSVRPGRRTEMPCANHPKPRRPPKCTARASKAKPSASIQTL